MLCKKCKTETKTRIVRTITASGSSQVWVQCLTCLQNANGGGVYLKHPTSLEELPIFNDYRVHCCEVCWALGAEYHHWAPRYLFGDEADSWPTGYLCPHCHAYWHHVIRAHNMERIP